LDKGFGQDVAAIAEIAAVPRILEVICRTTGMGFAAVARVTEERWIVCQVLDNIHFGLEPGGELRVETTLCHEVRQAHEVVAIDNVAEDEVYCGHHTPAMYGFQSYISMPIMLPDGRFFGTLCAIDPKPARLKNPETIGMFKLFAELIAIHLDANEKLANSEANLLDERRIAELRDQFIAVLGHDLRNPLAAIDAGTKLLLRNPLEDKMRSVAHLMQASVLRMTGLIDNVLDFARGKLGGGLTLDRESKPLEPTLKQVISEIETAWPERKVETEFDLAVPFYGDHNRIAQLFSNLLGNAVAHGSEDTPARVVAHTDASGLTLSVANHGKPIPPDNLTRLFQPFYRSDDKTRMEGLGLGLFIASEIARAHGGRLEVTSTEAETRFTFSTTPGV
jgi:signal transduction histidine kinase